MTVVPETPRLAEIQGLRGLAAFMVVALHATVALRATHPGMGTFATGAAGIDLFFVISGFVMGYISADETRSRADFLRRRILRIVPLYWLFTTLMVGIAIIAPQLLRTVRAEPGLIIASYFFIPFWNEGLGEIRPILPIGWTLNYEMWFYVAFAAALGLGSTRRLIVFALASAAAVGVHVLASPVFAPLAFLAAPVILEFVGGMALAESRVRGVRITGPVAIGLVVLGVLILIVGGLLSLGEGAWRAIYWGGPALCIVAAASLHPVRVARSGSATRSGDASYALYLSHLFIIALVIWAMPIMLPWWMAMTVLMLASIVVGLAVHRWVERPLQRYLADVTGSLKG